MMETPRLARKIECKKENKIIIKSSDGLLDNTLLNYIRSCVKKIRKYNTLRHIIRNTDRREKNTKYNIPAQYSFSENIFIF